MNERFLKKSPNDWMSLLQNLSNNQLHLEGADIISKMLLDNYYIKSIKLSGDKHLPLKLFTYKHCHCNTQLRGQVDIILD